jgi:hypothetical protein
VVSTSNPTAAFFSLSHHEAEWTPFQTQLPQKNPKECPGIEPGTSVFVVFRKKFIVVYFKILYWNCNGVTEGKATNNLSLDTRLTR